MEGHSRNRGTYTETIGPNGYPKKYRYPKMPVSREVKDVNKKFQCSDHQLSAANIDTKFHEQILNDSQEIEKRTPEWVPGGHDTNKEIVQ